MHNAGHDVDELIERSTQVEVPADVKARLQRRLAEFRAEVERPVENRYRRWMGMMLQSRMVRVSAAAVVVVAALVTALIVVPNGSRSAHVYAAAAAQLRSSQSLQYTFEIAPFTTVDFSFAAPAYRRINCSWGTEVRSDGSGRELILMHLTRNYILEEGKKANGAAESSDLVERFRALPQAAEEFLGERLVDGKKLIGYRVHEAVGSATPGMTTLDLWVDRATSNPDRVDITVQEPNKPVYQMHVRNIRVDDAVDREIFDMNPPAGYVAITKPMPGQPSHEFDTLPADVKPEIREAGEETAVVIPMKGSFQQTRAAVMAVEKQLKEAGVSPTGPAFGRFGSEAKWDAGYPVPPGTRVSPPFEVVTIPDVQVAMVVVKGPWGVNSTSCWTGLLKWVVEQGYVPDGAPTEIWSGVDADPGSQRTEMRIAVKRAE